MDDGRQDSPMPDRLDGPVSIPIPPVPPTPPVANNLEAAQDGLTGSASSRDDVNGSHSTASQPTTTNNTAWSSPNTSTASSPTSEEHKEHPPRSTSGWFPINEDTSLADPSEIARIEASGESSALDEAHWKKRFTELADPEYAVDTHGRIDWVISPFNGTKKNPQCDHVLTSPYVCIGGYHWRLKVFPKGIEGPYLAASLECKTQEQIAQLDTPKQDLAPVVVAAEQVEQPQPQSKSLPWRIPAQFEIVVYNPEEPRVHFSKGSAQSFSSRYSSCSFRRFAPVNVTDIGMRLPGQRQALLRNDKLAMVAYIRTFRDDTGCLFLRPGDSWDSLSICGLRGIHPTSYRGRVSQSLLAALVSWLFLPPIRQIVNQIKTASEAAPRSASYAARFACSLHYMANYVQWKSPSGTSNGQLDHIERALEWHGAILPESTEVFEVLELFRSILLNEATFLKLHTVVGQLESLGPMRLNLCYSSNKYVKDIQALLAPGQFKGSEEGRAKAFADAEARKPTVLHLQLPRQRFDDEKRKWKKSRRAYELNEQLEMSSVKYRLYAIVTHDDSDLRSRSFSTIVRADGTNFYKYGYQEYQRVVRLTKRQALVDPRENAYAAVYVRQDVDDESLLQCEFDINPPVVESTPDVVAPPSMRAKPNSTLGMTFVDSRAFVGSQHPGVVDFFNPTSSLVHHVELDGVNDAETAKSELEKIFVEDNHSKVCFVSEMDILSSRFKPDLVDIDFEFMGERMSNLTRWPIYLVHIAGRELLQQTRPRSNPEQSNSTQEDGNGPMLACGASEQSETTTSDAAASEEPTSSIEDTEMVDAEEEDGEADIQNGHVFGLEHEQLVFVKYFDVISQTLTGVSCFVADRSKNLRATVVQNLPAHISARDEQLKLYEEHRTSFESSMDDCVRSLNDSYSLFKDEFEDNDCTIIVEPILPQEQKDAVTKDGGIIDAGKFLYYLYARVWDHTLRMIRDKVVTKDYYGSRYFKGKMSRGYCHGEGNEITVGGEVYTGGFRMGMRSGKGHLTLPNNNTYQGDFEHGEPHGIGKQVDSMTGNTYTGGFQKGKKRGRGTTEWQQAEEEAKVCRVCYDKEQDCAFYPCGHVCACFDCAKQAGTCPMCHRDGSRAFKLYFAS